MTSDLTGKETVTLLRKEIGRTKFAPGPMLLGRRQSWCSQCHSKYFTIKHIIEDCPAQANGRLQCGIYTTSCALFEVDSGVFKIKFLHSNLFFSL